MTALLFRGRARIDAIDPQDRGMAYGDGLFETMRVHRGRIPWLDRHWRRALRGSDVLRLPLPALGDVELAFEQLFADGGDGVAKLIVTRGSGGRGYAPPHDAAPMWMAMRHPLPASPAQGLRLHACALRWAVQPALAGIKHCNRLEQVLARDEVQRAGADDGLVCDTGDAVICATSGNLLVLRAGTWFTPMIDGAGVAGVLRGWLLQHGLVLEARLTMADVAGADALAVCNAVRGILAVQALGPHRWAAHPAIDALRAALAQAHPAFAREHG